MSIFERSENQGENERRMDGSVREMTVCGIEMFRKMRSKAVKGDSVGLLLRGLTKNNVGRGDVLER